MRIDLGQGCHLERNGDHITLQYRTVLLFDFDIGDWREMNAKLDAPAPEKAGGERWHVALSTVCGLPAPGLVIGAVPGMLGCFSCMRRRRR